MPMLYKVTMKMYTIKCKYLISLLSFKDVILCENNGINIELLE